MSTDNQQQLEDLFDTRAEIRRLTKAVDATRAAAAEAKSELAAARARAEDVLIQIEHQQGRLAFDGQEETAKPKPTRRRPRKADQAEPRSQAV